jgi:hypothetical protein
MLKNTKKNRCNAWDKKDNKNVGKMLLHAHSNVELVHIKNSYYIKCSTVLHRILQLCLFVRVYVY